MKKEAGKNCTYYFNYLNMLKSEDFLKGPEDKKIK